MIMFPLYWWYIPLIITLIPFIVMKMDKGSVCPGLPGFLLGYVCWPVAAAIVITKVAISCVG